MTLLWLFLYLLVERLFELWLSLRNCRLLEARGGREFYPETFPRMVLLHTLFLLALLGESYPWRIALSPLDITLLAVFVLLQLARYWCIFSLGENWNTRIMLVPGGAVKKSGPYRFLSHPNYLVVTLEFLLLPLLMKAPLTLVVFFSVNLLILRERIRLEERALREFTDYSRQFPLK